MDNYRDVEEFIHKGMMRILEEKHPEAYKDVCAWLEGGWSEGLTSGGKQITPEEVVADWAAAFDKASKSVKDT